ncbi:unnamed protein product, partial [Ectocarpus sp. 12 AP-2014]
CFSRCLPIGLVCLVCIFLVLFELFPKQIDITPFIQQVVGPTGANKSSFVIPAQLLLLPHGLLLLLAEPLAQLLLLLFSKGYTAVGDVEIRSPPQNNSFIRSPRWPIAGAYLVKCDHPSSSECSLISREIENLHHERDEARDADL